MKDYPNLEKSRKKKSKTGKKKSLTGTKIFSTGSQKLIYGNSKITYREHIFEIKTFCRLTLWISIHCQNQYSGLNRYIP